MDMELAKENLLSTLRCGNWIIRNEAHLPTTELELLHKLLRHRVLTFYELIPAMKQGIVVRARECFNDHIRNRKLMPPSQTLSPHAIGYAMCYGDIRHEELVFMKFAYPNEDEQLMQEGEGLADELLAQLIARKGVNARAGSTQPCV